MAISDTDNIQKLISEWDALVRQGQLNRAADQIRKFNLQQIPRNSRKAFASVCRRAGLVAEGLRALQPIVRSQGPLADKPSAEETCEYGALLMRNGSLLEATTLLATIDGESLPVSLLYQGFCHVYAWEYEAAAPLFEKLLDSDIDDYSKLIALVNLGASLSALGQTEKALDVVNRAIERANEVQAFRLVGNCLEVRSQLRMAQADYARAKLDLQEAQAMFDKNKNYDLLLVAKNFAIIEALEKKSLEPLHGFRGEAIAKKHWESVREVDYFALKVRFDQRRFDHLLVGSPMPGYRKRVLKELPHTPSRSYLVGSEGSRILDLETGHGDAATDLNPGKKNHAVLSALVADFYAPRGPGTLFSLLYPNEYFDIGSSPNRVRQAIYRTRQWLKAQEIPAEVLYEDGRYRFAIDGKFGVRVPYASPALQTDALRFSDMRKALPAHRPFTVGEACALLNVSRSTFHRLAEHGLQTGQLRRLGVKRSTSYILEP